jgi:Holliday junction resolvasome RuvABC ATP-dependent DNA helicase subunit
MAYLEDVFVTEGVPEFTFVKLPNYTALLVDLRRKSKPVVIEGQSGTGKTTTVKKALAKIFPTNKPTLLTLREPKHLPIIDSISLESGEEIFVVDDFHRLAKDTKEHLANLAKVIAERDVRDGLPKLIIVGINNVGSDLIQLVPDLAKRMAIHRISAGTPDAIKEMIKLGSEILNIRILEPEGVFADSGGDYWLTQ